jgi:serine O-acetyltransferase
MSIMAADFKMVSYDVTIGSGVKILGNVHVGRSVVVGANSVVLSDVPDGVVAAGAPARIVKRRD